MASGTSFFNGTLYRKTMGRFWPLWALWGVGWAFLLPMNLLVGYFNSLRWADGVTPAPFERLAGDIGDLTALLTPGALLACGYGVLCAMAVFSYLYSSRSACMMHALPMKREGLFATQYLAGLSMAVLPLLAVALLTLFVALALVPAGLWGACLPGLGEWLLATLAMAVFFFSFASFCAMFTGHILALPAFYGIFNALVFVVYTLIRGLMAETLYGLDHSGAFPRWVEWLTPLYALSDAGDHRGQWREGDLVSHLAEPGVFAVYAAVGVVLALAALWVYQRRHVESAGDVVSVSIVRPIFKYGVTFCAGLTLGMGTAFFFGWYYGDNMLPLVLCVLLWAAAGYFAAEMLLKKSFRVFKAWKGCLAAVAVMALLCCALVFDWLGIEDRIPAADQVAEVSFSGSFGYPQDGGRPYFDSADPALIQKVIDLHRAILDDKEQNKSGSDGFSFDAEESDLISVWVEYTLKDGSTLSRSYHSVPVYKRELEEPGSTACAANAFLTDRALTEEIYGFDRYESGRLDSVVLSDVWNVEEQYFDDLYLEQSTADLLELWQAVRADFDAGAIGVRYLFDDRERAEHTYRTDLVFLWAPGSSEMSGPADGSGPMSASFAMELAITLTPDAGNTLAWLEEHQVLGEDYELYLNARDYDDKYPATEGSVEAPPPESDIQRKY